MARNERIKGGQKNAKSGQVWTEDELKRVFDLYLDLEGKGLHENNPAIIDLGKKLGRTTRSVEYQLLMFRNLERGGAYSVGNMNALCKKIWDSYRHSDVKKTTAKIIDRMYPFSFESWKSASAGGVRRPFDETTGRPTSKRIETAITGKLEAVIQDKNFPKAIFLVGGPGNGKTDTLEYLVRQLDSHYSLNGQLVNEAIEQFETYSRKIVINVSSINEYLPFEEIHLIQDASERDQDSSNAAESLLKDLDTILGGEFNGIFICCVNRGILDNLRRYSIKKGGKYLEYIKDLQLAVSPSLPSMVFKTQNLSIWPLKKSFSQNNAQFIPTFIWPMDVDSLFLPTMNGNTPFMDLLKVALTKEKWEFESEDLKFRPIYEGYQVISEDSSQKALLKYLRTYELFAGIRFTFRDMLSLIAYLFYCESYTKTVTLNEKIETNSSFVARFAALHALFTQLYFVKLFPWEIDKKDAGELLQKFKDLKTKESWARDAYSALGCLEVILKTRLHSEGSYIERIILNDQFKELDPAKSTSEMVISGTSLKFADIDQLFSRGINLGLAKVEHLLTPTEKEYLGMLRDIEEYSLSGDDIDRKKSSYLTLCVGFFRKYAALLCKRSIGLKYGLINHVEHAEKFVKSFQLPASLAELKEDVLKALFPDGKLRISFCSSIGQPKESLSGDAYLNLGNISGVEGLLKKQYQELPNWDIAYLQIEKGKVEADVHLNFSTYLKIIKLSKMNIMPGCVPPDLLMWKDTITSSLSSFEVRDMTKLYGKVIELSNNTKINIKYDDSLEFRLV
jgi:hypothetical protein